MPIIEAELPDGTILEFPDGTAPDVVRNTVRRKLGINAGSPSPSDIAAGAKPTVEQKGGTISTEKTITVEADGRHFVIPTIIDGKSYTPDAAADAFMARKIKPIGDFGSADEARVFAEQRSRDLDKAFGGSGRLMKGDSAPKSGGVLNRYNEPTAEELDTASRPAQAIRLKGGRQVALVRPDAVRDNYDKETQGETVAPWTGEGGVLEAAPAMMVAGGRSAGANVRRMVGEESAASRRATLNNETTGETPAGAATGRAQPGALDRQRALLREDEAAVQAAERDASTAKTDLLLVTPANMNTPQKAVTSLIQSAPPTLAGIAAGILTRNPALAMTIAGGGGSAIQAGSTYGEAREKGASHRLSSTAATIDGILEGVGEALPLGIALKQGSTVANRIFGTIVAETGQEAATQVMQDFNAFLTYNPNITLKEAWENLKVAALSGGMGGTVYGTAGAIADGARQRALVRDDAATDLKTGADLTPESPAQPDAAASPGNVPPAAEAGVTPINPVTTPRYPPEEVEQEPVIEGEALPEGEATAMQLAFEEAQRKAGTRAEPATAETPADVEAAEAKVNTAPTEAQKEAGNYAKGHLKLQGLDIAIENPRGSTRSGQDAAGNQWETTMPAAYGYVKRSEGADGDQVDVYVGPNPISRQVYVVDQIDPKTRKFDEHKVMIGYSDQSEALAAYDQAFSDGTGAQRRGSVTPMAMGNFKKWLKAGDTKAPYAYKYRSPVYDALQDDNTRASLAGMRSAVGASERGGRLIVDEASKATAPNIGDVLGKTNWLGEQWWFGRPDPSLSADQARRAIDKALSGEKLGTREDQFVQHLLKWVKDTEAQFDAEFVESSGYNDLSKEEQATLDQVVADAVSVLGESTVDDIRERLAIQTESEAEYETRLREELGEAVAAAGDGGTVGQTAEVQAGQSAERGQQGSRAPPENAGGVDGQSDQIGAGASDGTRQEAARSDDGAIQRGDAGTRSGRDGKAVRDVQGESPGVQSGPAAEKREDAPRAGPDADGATAKAVTDKTPSKEGVSTFGSDNKIFTQDAAEAARATLRKKLGQLNTGIDPEVIQAGMQLAGYYIEGGTRAFPEFSKKMIADLGEAVRPYLKSWYLAVRNYPGFDNTGMQSEAEINGMPDDDTPANARVRNQERDGEVRRLQSDNTVTQRNGKPFKTEESARTFQTQMDLTDTHEVRPRDGGFVLSILGESNRPSARKKQADRLANDPEHQKQETLFKRAEKIGKAADATVTAYENGDITLAGFAESLDLVEALEKAKAPRKTSDAVATVTAMRDALLALIDAKEGMNASMKIMDSIKRNAALDAANEDIQKSNAAMREAYGEAESTPMLNMTVAELYDMYDAIAGDKGRVEKPVEQAPLELTSETPADLAAKAQQESAQKMAEAAKSIKEAADAMRDLFVLSGSNRETDQAAARGQSGLFDAPAPQAETPAAPARFADGDWDFVTTFPRPRDEAELAQAGRQPMSELKDPDTTIEQFVADSFEEWGGEINAYLVGRQSKQDMLASGKDEKGKPLTDKRRDQLQKDIASDTDTIQSMIGEVGDLFSDAALIEFAKSIGAEDDIILRGVPVTTTDPVKQKDPFDVEFMEMQPFPFVFRMEGGRSAPVLSVIDAQQKWVAFRDATAGGVSQVGNGGAVYDKDNNLVARISYNGRMWDKDEKELTATPESDAPIPLSEIAKQAEETTDKNSFTLERMNKDEMESVTFKRGEYVEVSISDDDKAYGDITGISHAKREAKIGNLWYEFGRIYKAERPAVVAPVTVPMSEAVAASNKKNGAGLTAADKIATLEDHTAFLKRLRDGDVTVDEMKAAFESVIKSKTELQAQLSKLSKGQLVNEGWAGGFTRPGDSKESLVKRSYSGIVTDFNLGDSIGYNPMEKDGLTKAVRKEVEALTPEKIAEFAERVAAARAERKERLDGMKQALVDPQTLPDFRFFLDNKKLSDLTPEQLARYDELVAEQEREGRDRRMTERAKITAAGEAVGAKIIETKHTKKGHDLFVVQLEQRVERDDYNRLNAAAKKLGGYYSSYRGGGAVVGFQFTTMANAQAFQALAGGDTTAATEAAQARQEERADEKEGNNVERLRAMADKLEEKANESLNQDRKANTARRARMASSAEAQARGELSIARTMRNIAEAIEAGKVKHIDLLRTKVQVEMLNRFARVAHEQAIFAQRQSRDEKAREAAAQTPVSVDDVAHAEYPVFEAWRSDIAAMGRQLAEVDGAKLLGERLLKTADDSAAYIKALKKDPTLRLQALLMTSGGKSATFPYKNEAEGAWSRSPARQRSMVVQLEPKVYGVVMTPSVAKERGLWKGDDDARIKLTKDGALEVMEKAAAAKVSYPYLFDFVKERRQRLESMGIESPAAFRAALREFIALQAAPPKADRAKELERALIGKDVGIDFFPTPAGTAETMVERAGIEPGMAVLEPSAGNGNIAEAIREVGIDPDVVEFSAPLREVLEAKGFEVVGTDFMAIDPRGHTYGDVFKHKDGRRGILGSNGGLGSGRYKFIPVDGDGRNFDWVDRDDLTGIEKRGSNSGYDRIVMNPPFSNGRDIDHVQHAYKLLKDGGRIVAIMGEGSFTRSDKKAKDFRDWLDSVGGTDEKLPPGTFMDTSLMNTTGANARMVIIDKADAPRFSRTGPIIPHRDIPFAQQVLDELAAHDELFRHPVSQSADLATVFAEVAPSTRFMADDTRADEATESGADRRFLFATEKERYFYVYEKGNQVWIDVSRLDNGDGGNAIYAAALNYAYNNKKVFVGDPEGLMTDAVIRRTVAMMSSALRFGTTRHMEAAPDQKLGDPQAGIAPLDWSGNDFERTRALMDTFLTTLYNLVPELKDFRYDFQQRQFIGPGDKPVIFDEVVHAVNRRTGAGSPRMARAGTATLLRGIFIQSLASSPSGERPAILEQVLRRARQLVEEGGLAGLFYRNQAPERGLSVSAIETALRPILAKWNNAPDVIILTSIDQAPQPIRDMDAQQRSQDASGDVAGMWWGGKVYLFARYIDTIDYAQTVLAHEVLGHYGLRGTFGDEFDAILTQMVNARRGDVEAKAAHYGFDMSNEADRLAAAEEVLAEMAQTQPQITWVQRAIMAIRKFLRRLGFNVPTSDSEIITDYILPARAFVRRGGQEQEFSSEPAMASRTDSTKTEAFNEWFGDSKVVDADGKPLVVYHGTSQDFTEFKHKIRAGFYFTADVEYANLFAEGGPGGANVIPAYLSLKNPVDLRKGISPTVAKQLEDAGYYRIDDILAMNPDEYWEMLDDETLLMDSLVAAGYDGAQIVEPNGSYDTKGTDKEVDAWVAFKPGQIKSAVGNRGTFDPGNADIRFSRTEAVNDAAADLKQPHVEFIGNYVGDIGTFKKYAVYPRTIAALESDFTPVYLTAESQFETRDRYAAELGRMAEKYFDLSNAQRSKVDSVLELGRLKEEALGGDKMSMENTGQNARLSKKGDTITLTDEEKTAYWNVRRMFNKALTMFRDQALADFGVPVGLLGKDIRASLVEMIKDAEPRQKAYLQAALGIFDEIEAVRKSGYIPFSRWGDVVIVARDRTGATLWAEKVETGMIERNMPGRLNLASIPSVRTALDAVRERFKNEQVEIKAFNVPERVPLEGDVRMADLDMLAELARVDNQQWDSVREQLAKGLQSRGFRKHLIGSDNVPGYSTDFERSIADYIIGISGYLSRRQHASKWETAIAAIDTRKPKLIEYAKSYQKYVNDPQEEWFRLRQAGFLFYIAGVPASAMVNLTQVQMLTAPYLTQFVGAPRVQAELTRAYADVSAMGSVSRGFDLFDPDKAPADVRDDLRAAWDEGFFVPLETYELMGRAYNRTATQRKLQRGIDDGINVVSIAFQGAERINRLVSFIAAHRIGRIPAVESKANSILKDNPLAQEELGVFSPKRFAEWVIDETHFRMGKINRPGAMRGIGTAILQFRGFTIQTLELWTRMMIQNGPEGKAMAAYSLLLMFALAGIWGMPGADDLRNLIEQFYKAMTGEDLDLKTKVRELAYKLTGSATLAQMFSKGATFPAGLDLSGRIGMGNVAPDSPLQVFGIPADLTVGRPSRALEAASRGHWRLAMAELLPNFVKNPLQAADWAESGVRSQATGKVAIAPENVTTGDVAQKSIGFTPARISNIREAQYAKRRAEFAMDELRKDYYAKLGSTIASKVRAERVGDIERAKKLDADIKATYKEIGERNQGKAPHQMVVIRAQTLRERVKDELSGTTARTSKKRMARSRGAEIDEAYGLVE